jgi:hypothetical protein
VLTMGRNRCSRSPGITAHDRPEWVLTMRRNTQADPLLHRILRRIILY